VLLQGFKTSKDLSMKFATISNHCLPTGQGTCTYKKQSWQNSKRMKLTGEYFYLRWNRIENLLKRNIL
jgi:hypothetical protein